MVERTEICVVGAGVMGLATAHALARAGREVTLLERFGIGHPHGSSHGDARIFRLAYPDPAFVRMGRDARPLWDRLAGETGATLLRPAPAVSIGRTVAALADAMRAGGAHIRMVGAEELRARHPMLRLDGVDRAIVEPEAAVIAAAVALATFRAAAQAGGASIREETPVAALAQDEGGVDLTLAGGGRIRARAAIVTAGSWAKGLLAGAGIELPTWSTVETVAYYDGPPDAPILLDWDDPTVYMLPTPGGRLKAAEHIAGPTCEPDEQRAPDPAAPRRVGAWLASRIEGIDPEPAWMETCRYTMTADERFILRREGRIVIGSPCSGHGFKFAPLIGEQLAGLAADAVRG